MSESKTGENENIDIEMLAQKNGGHWGQHPDYPASDWQYEVANGDTRNGYWEWVEAKLSFND